MCDRSNTAGKIFGDARNAVFSADEIWANYSYFMKAVLPVAREAGVSAETVYKAFGNKPALLRAAWFLMFRGDESDFDYGWEERWIRDEGYSKIVPPAIFCIISRIVVGTRGTWDNRPSTITHAVGSPKTGASQI